MANRKIVVSPSILAGDFAHLALEVQRVEASGADWLHVDVMDGHFVPNLTLGPQVVAAINRSSEIPLDVHLMMYNPFAYVERFVEAGADMLTIHFEATEDVEETLKYIRTCGIKAGLAFCPETSASMIPKYLPLCDLVLLMTVHPGFGGQKFMHEVVKKIEFTSQICRDLNLNIDIQVDGGIDDVNVKQCIKAGANSIVAGTYFFQSPDMAQAVKQLRGE